MILPRFAITFAGELLAEALLERMAQSGISAESIVLLDRSERAGSRLAYGDTYLTTLDQYAYDYENLTAILLLQADDELENLFQHADCYVISHHPDSQTRPLYLADAENSSLIGKKPGVIKLASAELSTLMSVIQPLQSIAELDSIQVVNVLSAASFGKPAIDELASQTIELLNGRDVVSSVFPMQLAFNMIPLQTEPQAQQLSSLLPSSKIKCNVHTIVVPAFHGLCISVALDFRQDMSIRQVKQLFNDTTGITLKDKPVSPLTHCKSGINLHIFELNQPQKDAKRLQFWVISDWVRNGLIQNYLNVMEILLKTYL